MKTYYILDSDTNTWSSEPLLLKDIMAMRGVTGSTMLADARTRLTMTVADALAASRKPRKKSPLLSMFKRMQNPEPSAAKSTAVPLTTGPMPTRLKPHRSEYKVLDRLDSCFGENFCANALEQALNTYARQGWRVLSCVLPGSNSPAEHATRDFLIVMERKVGLAPHQA